MTGRIGLRPFSGDAYTGRVYRSEAFVHVLIRLLGLIRPYKRRALVAWLSLVASGVFVLLTPLTVQWALDIGLGVKREGDRLVIDPDTRLLVVAALAIVGSALARGVFAFGQQ